MLAHHGTGIYNSLEIMRKIRIAITDDYKIYRDGLKLGLTQTENMQVVLEASNGEELLNALEILLVDVILLDIKMPKMDGIEATKHIRKKYPQIKVLIISMYEDEDYVLRLMEAGANGYLLKNAEPEEICLAIEAVTNNDYYFNDLVNKAFLKRIVHNKKIKPKFNGDEELTERDVQVLRLICEEKTAVEIGKEIFLSARSVEGIKARLMEKIGVKNTAGLIMYAVKKGLVADD